MKIIKLLLHEFEGISQERLERIKLDDEYEEKYNREKEDGQVGAERGDEQQLGDSTMKCGVEEQERNEITAEIGSKDAKEDKKQQRDNEYDPNHEIDQFGTRKEVSWMNWSTGTRLAPRRRKGQ